MKDSIQNLNFLSLNDVPNTFPSSPEGFEGIEPEQIFVKLETLPPTPKGYFHLGPIESGKFLQLRFELPKKRPIKYFVGLNNIVAYNGGGFFYQLEVRKDSPNGPVVFKGKEFNRSDGPGSFNDEDYSMVEIEQRFLTDEDFKRGYIDLYVTVHVKGDNWTMYRDFDDGSSFDMKAYVLTDSRELVNKLLSVQKMRSKGVLIIPQPREINIKNEVFYLTQDLQILLNKGAVEDDIFTASLLADEIYQISGFKPEISKLNGSINGKIVLGVVGRDSEFDFLVKNRGLNVNKELGEQGYVLDVSSDTVIGAANTSTGLFYAVQTLLQLLEKNLQESIIKGVHIRDWPELEYRMVQYDVARGQLVKPEYIKRMIKWLARAKINMLMVYLEDDFKYRKYPFLGREGTFTPEVARELSEYARKFHVQLVPQQEALGHMSSMLGHPELEELREAGNSWVICPLHPKTIPFLNDLFTELVESFTNTDFVHVGADEFEGAFGKCPRCREKINEIGFEGLYAYHMHNLNKILKSKGEKMMFWTQMPPSHHELTLDTARKKLLPEDAIPFLWHYGKGDFIGLIKLYKEAGVKDLFVAPAVTSWHLPFPDYETTLWNIRNYIVSAAKEKCMGECTCTWELLHGSLFETAWYGLIYSAECAWSPEWTEKRFFDRKFAKFWFGLNNPEISNFVTNPWGNAAKGFWASPQQVKSVFFSTQKEFCDVAINRGEGSIDDPKRMIEACNNALQSIDKLLGYPIRNKLTLKMLRIPILMYKITALKIDMCKELSDLYIKAFEIQRTDREKAVNLLNKCAGLTTTLLKNYEKLLDEFKQAVEICGASPSDYERFMGIYEYSRNFSNMLENIINRFLNEGDQLPAPYELGLQKWNFVKVANWSPENVSTDFVVIRFDITEQFRGKGMYVFKWQYDYGAHGMEISETWIEAGGRIIALDKHGGWTGWYSSGNRYFLKVEEIPPDERVYICGKVRTDGGTDSYGSLWMGFTKNF